MKLFEYKDFKLKIADEALTLKAFKDLHDRDKSKGKEIAFKELAFIYHMCDIKSNFLIINNENERTNEVKLQVDLPDSWTVDDKIKSAMDFYKERTITPIAQMYLHSVKAALDATSYLSEAGVLLRERNDKGAVVTQVSSITSALNSITESMKKLKLAEKEVIKEQKETEGRMKGSQEMGYFEDGF